MVGDIPLRCLLLKKDEEFGGYSSSCRIHPETGMKGTGSYQLGVIIAYYSLPPKHDSFLWYSNFGLSDFTVVKSCRTYCCSSMDKLVSLSSTCSISGRCSNNFFFLSSSLCLASVHQTPWHTAPLLATTHS